MARIFYFGLFVLSIKLRMDSSRDLDTKRTSEKRRNQLLVTGKLVICKRWCFIVN